MSQQNTETECCNARSHQCLRYTFRSTALTLFQRSALHHNQRIVLLCGTAVQHYALESRIRLLVVCQTEVALANPVFAIACQSIIRVLLQKPLEYVDRFIVPPPSKAIEGIFVSNRYPGASLGYGTAYLSPSRNRFAGIGFLWRGS